MHFERVNATPVRPLIHKGGVPTIGGIFRQDDELWVSSDDRFVCDLWVATATGVVMEDVDALGVLQEFIAKGAPAEDIRLARRTIVYFEQHPGRSCSCHGRLDLVDLPLQLADQRRSSA